MSFSKVYGVQNNLLNAGIVDVEVDISGGLFYFTIVGLGDKAIEEAKDRVNSALKNSGHEYPKSASQKVVISLAPAHTKKNGPIFDLAMAICFLKSSKQLSFSVKDKIFIGELSLDGKLREVSGVLPMIVEAKKRGFKEVFLPKSNVEEAAIINGIDIYGAETLNEVADHLDELKTNQFIEPSPQTKLSEVSIENEILMEHVKGNESAKRALIVALSGGHNICFYGPPGTGKTMLAKVAKSLLPKLTFDEVLEVNSIYSVSGELGKSIKVNPPYRSPHHTSSYASIVGGGTNIKPGEISLAHRGVLFLDEFPEFDRRVIDSLRQPIEDKVVQISRSKESAILPADFLLMLSMNPCKCGFYGYNSKKCSCTMAQIMKYQKKVSGPIMDRVDIWIEVSVVEYQKLIEQESRNDSLPAGRQGKQEDGKDTEIAKKKIKDTREIQIKKYKKLNGSLSTNELEKFLIFEDGVKEFFDTSAEQLGLSARSYTKILKLAQTIMQMGGGEILKKEHILEALSWRPSDKFFI
jgi:magnesium chelatase family protein